jgi:hypothetical protein
MGLKASTGYYVIYVIGNQSQVLRKILAIVYFGQFV